MNSLYYLTNMTSVWEVAYTLKGKAKKSYFRKSKAALQFAENISKYTTISSVVAYLDNKIYRKYK